MSSRTGEVANYISDIAKELAVMADSENLPFLGYLLQLVEAEAKQVSESKPPPKASAKTPERKCL